MLHIIVRSSLRKTCFPRKKERQQRADNCITLGPCLSHPLLPGQLLGLQHLCPYPCGLYPSFLYQRTLHHLCPQASPGQGPYWRTPGLGPCDSQRSPTHPLEQRALLPNRLQRHLHALLLYSKMYDSPQGAYDSRDLLLHEQVLLSRCLLPANTAYIERFGTKSLVVNYVCLLFKVYIGLSS